MKEQSKPKEILRLENPEETRIAHNVIVQLGQIVIKPCDIQLEPFPSDSHQSGKTPKPKPKKKFF